MRNIYLLFRRQLCNFLFLRVVLRCSIHNTSRNADHNPQILTPPPSYVTHFWTSGEQNGGGHELCSQSVTLLENRTLIEQGTTGMRTWTASIFLANYLISNPRKLAHRHE